MKLFTRIAALLIAVGLGFLLGRGQPPRTTADLAGHRILYWVDPMHPTYKSDHPGTAPDCGMPLEPAYADSSSINASMPANIGSSSDRFKIELPVVAVTRMERAGTQSLRLPGRVVAEETRVYTVNAGVDGFVKKTHGDTTGSFVNKNQRLAVIYSPEFLTVSGGYLSASERTQNTSSREGLAASQGITGVQNWGDRLRNLGMSEAQIAELRQTRRIPDDIYVVSPANGFILARNIAANARFERHTEFYRIADLSSVWILADLAAEDVQYFRPGAIARITCPDLKHALSARLINVLPTVDPETRTVKVRLEAENPQSALRPEMFVNIEFEMRAPAGLSVPSDSVIDSGLGPRVFVEVKDGVFEQRKVKTGWRFKDRTQIVHGLTENERIAAGASFLVDSEARLDNIALRSALQEHLAFIPNGGRP